MNHSTTIINWKVLEMYWNSLAYNLPLCTLFIISHHASFFIITPYHPKNDKATRYLTFTYTEYLGTVFYSVASQSMQTSTKVSNKPIKTSVLT